LECLSYNPEDRPSTLDIVKRLKVLYEEQQDEEELQEKTIDISDLKKLRDTIKKETSSMKEEILEKLSSDQQSQQELRRSLSQVLEREKSQGSPLLNRVERKFREQGEDYENSLSKQKQMERCNKQLGGRIVELSTENAQLKNKIEDLEDRLLNAEASLKRKSKSLEQAQKKLTQLQAILIAASTIVPVLELTKYDSTMNENNWNEFYDKVQAIVLAAD